MPGHAVVAVAVEVEADRVEVAAVVAAERVPDVLQHRQ
jgi:hypothetical protein